ncbi:MAG: rod shape-determining protein MreC [Tissierellaceae bacterium]|nr:rod shape-determining protein MreC [Tissierellaceae bacterium]
MYFLKKYKNRMMVTGVAIILIIIIGVTNKDRLFITKFEKIIGNIISPITKITYSIGNKVTGFFGNISNISNLKEENEELKIKVASLEEENRDLQNLVGKYDFLKNEAGLIDNSKYSLISAQITSMEPGSWYDTFIIDKGLKDGIQKNANVIQGIETENEVIEEGVIGRVTDVGDNWAKVVPIIDEQNRISFKIIRTQDGGVLTGSSNGEVSGYLFDSEADIVPGDKLYTSGLGEIFLEDLYIGEVEDVQEIEEELIKKVTVKPAIDFKKLYKVFVIID